MGIIEMKSGLYVNKGVFLGQILQEKDGRMIQRLLRYGADVHEIEDMDRSGELMDVLDYHYEDLSDAEKIRLQMVWVNRRQRRMKKRRG